MKKHTPCRHTLVGRHTSGRSAGTITTPFTPDNIHGIGNETGRWLHDGIDVSDLLVWWRCPSGHEYQALDRQANQRRRLQGLRRCVTRIRRFVPSLTTSVPNRTPIGTGSMTQHPTS